MRKLPALKKNLGTHRWESHAIPAGKTPLLPGLQSKRVQDFGETLCRSISVKDAPAQPGVHIKRFPRGSPCSPKGNRPCVRPKRRQVTLGGGCPPPCQAACAGGIGLHIGRVVTFPPTPLKPLPLLSRGNPWSQGPSAASDAQPVLPSVTGGKSALTRLAPTAFKWPGTFGALRLFHQDEWQ